MTIEKSESQPLEEFSWPTTESIRKERGWLWCTWHWKVKKYVEWFYPNNIWWRCIAFYQRRTRGFDNSDLWSLDHTISKFILPRLIAWRNMPPSGSPGDLDPCWKDPDFNGCKNNHPGIDGYEIWLSMLDDMIYFFDCRVKDLEERIPFDDKDAWERHITKFEELYVKDQERYKKGEEYFHKYFRDLWD